MPLHIPVIPACRKSVIRLVSVLILPSLVGRIILSVVCRALTTSSSESLSLSLALKLSTSSLLGDFGGKLTSLSELRGSSLVSGPFQFHISSEVKCPPCPLCYLVFRGGTPLYGLNRDVRPDRVWFSEDFVLNGVSISSIFVLNRVSLHDLIYSLTAEPSQKAKFLPVCQCSAY